MTNNEKQYLKNVEEKNRCGYWYVCSDHACGCAPSAPVSKGFNESLYEEMKQKMIGRLNKERMRRYM
jgi:hypothetical protein